MKGAPRFALALAPVAIALAVSGCQDGSGFLAKKPAAGGGAAPTATSVKLVDRDVEAPEVFQVMGDALWDGRPSLGGVWVASPDAKDPERVIMRNPANGKFVIGALFRREAGNPGPALQISSDAAEALGMLAGQPGKLSVTALRREEAPRVAPDAANPILGAPETVANEAAPASEVVAKPGKPAAGAVVATALPTPGAPAKPAAPGAKPAAAPAKPAAPVAASAGGGVIQIGIFSVEANAKRAVETLSKAGIPARIVAEQSKGKAIWSVTASGDAATLAKVKGAGFADAYFLKG